MNEVMCLAEDLGIDIYYEDTDSMHLPEEDVPRLEKAFQEKYGRTLRGKGLGQFHPDFSFSDMKGKEMKEYDDVHSVELIALGKKAYLDVLEATHKETGEVKQSLHIRMKGVPSDSLEYAVHNSKEWHSKSRIDSVRGLYLRLLAGKSQEFDLTNDGLRTCFDSNRNFTVKSRDKFTRNLQFPKEELLQFGVDENWELV